MDLTLMSLLAQLKTVFGTDAAERKKLSKRIWRRKRPLNREANGADYPVSCGRRQKPSPTPPPPSPPSPPPLPLPPSMGQDRVCTCDGDKLLEGRETSPEDLLTEYLRELYGLQGDAQAKAADARALANTGWINVEDEVREASTSGIDATGFATALKKLKKVKNSPDGLTAEILQSVPLEQRAHLSADMTRRMRSLDLPEEWFETTAALACKTAGANSLAKCRPIASLSTMRKICGYMFFASLPQLEFRSRQTALVKGCHAIMGAHMYLRIGELCREWNLECNAAQLNVRKAFDHASHAASLRAMEEMGCRCTLKSSDGKGMVSEQDPCETGNQDLGAGEPGKRASTGSPREPDNLCNFLECVFMRCEERWAKKGWGFWLDGKRWGARVTRTSSTAQQSATWRACMIRDIPTERVAVGLGLGANKTHWSSDPTKLGETLHVGTESTEWEQVLVFVGMALTGFEWIIVGIDQTQTESRGSVHAKVDTHVQVKVCEWTQKDTSGDFFSVGERLVVECVVDADKGNEKCV